MQEENTRVIIATGGTGGHVLPAASLANYLNKIGFSTVLTTDERGLKFVETEIIKNVKIINASPFIKENKITSTIKIISAILSSLFSILKIKPKFIFGMGGYASFPLCIAAYLLRIPFIIYENNLLIGKANKFLMPFTKKIFTSYEEVAGISKKYKSKQVIIGNIIREKILHGKLNEKEISDILNILVLGGSQAAKIFAETLPKIFIECKKNNLNIKVYQQCLPDQVSQLKKTYETYGIECELFTFTFDILKYYRLSHLAITRAGSSALAELLNFNLPIISIPLKTSADNHQFKNAQYFERKGYGIMLEENNIEKELFDILLVIKLAVTKTKNGFVNSIGCNLKMKRSNHLFAPLISTPTKGTKINNTSDNIKIGKINFFKKDIFK